MPSWERERQIRNEERIRHEERQDIEEREAKQRHKAQKTYEQDAAYVEEYGQDNAAKITFFKWAIGGLILSVIALIQGTQDEGFSAAIGPSAAVLGVFCAIGIWRAIRYRNFGQ